MTPKKQNAQMMEIMGFSKADLALNKKGELSGHQIEQHQSVRTKLRNDPPSVSENIIIASALLTVAIIYVVLVITGIFWRLEDMLGVLTVPAFTLATVLFVSSMQRSHSLYVAELRVFGDPNYPMPPISVAKGRITKITTQKTSLDFKPHSYARIAGRKIRVMPELLDVIDEETIYRFYFLVYGESDMFLSAEVVNNGNKS